MGFKIQGNASKHNGNHEFTPLARYKARQRELRTFRFLQDGRTVKINTSLEIASLCFSMLMIGRIDHTRSLGIVH